MGYGAPGRATPSSTTAGSVPTSSEYTVDRNPYKQGKYTTRDPHSDLRARANRGDEAGLILMLPVEPEGEIGMQLAHTREWGATR